MSDGPVPPAERRLRVRMAVGLTAVAVLAAVAGVALVTSPPHAPQSTHGSVVTSAPPETPSVSPTASPTVEPTEAPRPIRSTIVQNGCAEIEFGLRDTAVAGQALPASIMLRPSDWGRCWALTSESVGYELVTSRPDVCLDGKAFAADVHRVAGRTHGYTPGPLIQGQETVTRYADGHADGFLDEVRARVQECAEFRWHHDEDIWQARIVRTGFAGDESLLVSVGRTLPTLDPLYPEYVTAVVRVGDHVIVLDYLLHLLGDRDLMVRLARKAVDRF